MKLFSSLLTLFLTLAAGEVHAKKLGGGKSFGKTHQTAPVQQRQASDTDRAGQTASPTGSNTMNAAPAAASSAAASSAAKKGMMGGLLGGLLAGGLIAALLGGAFEGIQILDILIFGLIAFLVFKFLRSRQAAAGQPAMAGATAGSPAAGEASHPFATRQGAFDTEATGTFGRRPSSSDASSERTIAGETIPFDLPEGFDVNAFVKGAREHYRTLQEAWNRDDREVLREYTSPELFEALVAEREALEGEQHTEILHLDASLVRANRAFGKAELSIQFSGEYRDLVEGVEAPITDIWHLERDLREPGAPWIIVGIES